MGFHVRNRNEQDVDDEVDVDGDDEAVFGDAQFTEGDILVSGNDPQHATDGQELDVEIEDDEDIQTPHKSLRDLVAEGKIPSRSLEEENTGWSNTVEVAGNTDVDRADIAIALARKRRHSSALVGALEYKIKLLVGYSRLPDHSLTMTRNAGIDADVVLDFAALPNLH